MESVYGPEIRAVHLPIAVKRGVQATPIRVYAGANPRPLNRPVGKAVNPQDTRITPGICQTRLHEGGAVPEIYGGGYAICCTLAH